MKYKYLEIVKDSTQEVVSRLDVTGKSERAIERIEGGMSLNLNHNQYSIRETDSETELPKI